MKALAESNCSFTAETLEATYKANVRPILNYSAPIWFTQVFSSYLGKLEVIQAIGTGCHHQTTTSHLRAETGVLPLKANLELCSQQFYASAFQPLQASYLIVPSPPDPLHLRATFQASYHRILRGLGVRSDYPNAPHLICGGVLEEGAYPLARRLLRSRMIEEIVRSLAPNKVFMATPLPIAQPNNCCPGLTEARCSSSDPAIAVGSSSTATP